ncbi:MAG: hypothetical protein A2X36_16710 [Elusimicrobia bacterium GWA2_69_24]|nr:MAG: hypothetical protein A2X36_16710 [Elusimicrobia bacterium GWA2_69_24]HBL16642.1 4Fe-4S ferredoxin [Elusimicrobiota bacterium]
MSRQQWRKLILFSIFLAMPPLFFWYSPWHLWIGARQGILCGSGLLFAVMFLSGLFLGRAYCGWACSPAGIQEAWCMVQDKRLASQRFTWTKWLVWLPWMAAVAVAALQARGFQEVMPLMDMDEGLSVTDSHGYTCYYSVLFIISALCLPLGRRAFCHHFCWMGPFCTLGTWVQGALRTPSLRLRADRDLCDGCGECDAACPMSLEVAALVKSRRLRHTDCVLCGSCVDACSRRAIAFGFGRPDPVG